MNPTDLLDELSHILGCPRDAEALLEAARRKADAKTEMLIATALPIMQGLLASGNYTDTDNDLTPYFKKWPPGDYDKASKRPAYAVMDALDLADELIKQAEQDAK